MAARLRPHHQEDIRLKIQGSQIVNYLQNLALTGKCGKNAALRIQAARILLNKVLPDQQQISGDPENPVILDTPDNMLERARRVAFTLIHGAMHSQAKLPAPSKQAVKPKTKTTA